MTRIQCPTCEGRGYVLGIDARYPQDGNVALRCTTCRGSRFVDGAAAAAAHNDLPGSTR